MRDQFEREHDELVDMVNSGEISEIDYRKEMRNLEDSYRASAEQAADEAYNNEMGRW